MNKNEVLLTLLKSIDPALISGGFKLCVPEGTEKGTLPLIIKDDCETFAFKGEDGTFMLVMKDKQIELLCSHELDKETQEMDYKSSFVSLFDIEQEDFNVKDIKSLANEVNESLGVFYDFEIQNVSKEKSPKDLDKQEIIEKKKKKANKIAKESFEPVNLAARISNIYPEIKEEVSLNAEKYEMFLGEEFFDKFATKLILNSIRKNDRQTLKKLFNAFNTFYDEGSKDTQSLIAVSILGRNIEKEPELMDIIDDYMEDNLGSAVKQIVKYLRKPTSKGMLKKFDNPKPYVSKRNKK